MESCTLSIPEAHVSQGSLGPLDEADAALLRVEFVRLAPVISTAHTSWPDTCSATLARRKTRCKRCSFAPGGMAQAA